MTMVLACSVLVIKSELSGGSPSYENIQPCVEQVQASRIVDSGIDTE